MTPPRLFLTCLALLAILVLAPGIWEPTGLTGKDEFLLGLRTPMEMMADDRWLFPFLDGAPRIRKPPLIYWIVRASYETFGVSLGSARAVAIGFAALFVVAAAGIGRRLLDAQSGFVAGCVLLGCLGLHSESRRLMLDVPVAAWSASAFWAFLVWRDTLCRRWLVVAALCLAAGILTKGPVALLLAGTGIAALIGTRLLAPAALARHWPALAGALMLCALIAIPWFIAARWLYPEAVQLAYADEIETRQFLRPNPELLAGLFNIGLPWMFVFVAAAWRQRRESGLPRFLLVWFGLAVLPFLFFKSFDRYLIGALLPMALFIAQAGLAAPPRWSFRLGALVALLFGGLLAAFAARFDLGGWPWLVAPALYLLWAWWLPRPPAHTLAAPAVFSAALLGGLFPALGVNAVPPDIVELGRQRDIVFHHGPQPALLAALSGRPHRLQAVRVEDVPALAARRAIIFCETSEAGELVNTVTRAGYRAAPAGEYFTLASHGSGLRFARIGAKSSDWRAAWQTRSLAPLKTRIVWFEIAPSP